MTITKMKTETVSRIELCDIPELAELEKECFSVPWSEAALNILLSDHAFGLKKSVDGKIVAYVGVMFVENEAQVLNLASLPAYRKQGYARELLKELFSEIAKIGCDTLTLEVRESNIPAYNLYKSVGFSEIGKRKEYYSAPKEAAIIMEIRL